MKASPKLKVVAVPAPGGAVDGGELFRLAREAADRVDEFARVVEQDGVEAWVDDGILGNGNRHLPIRRGVWDDAFQDANKAMHKVQRCLIDAGERERPDLTTSEQRQDAGNLRVSRLVTRWFKVISCFDPVFDETSRYSIKWMCGGDATLAELRSIARTLRVECGEVGGDLAGESLTEQEAAILERAIGNRGLVSRKDLAGANGQRTPRLERLRERGMLEVFKQDGRGTVYRITDKGRRASDSYSRGRVHKQDAK